MIIAGRDGIKATAVASEFGDNVSGVTFDLQETESYARVLEDVDQVVMCVDLSRTAFVEACLERGIDYVDVTASDEFFRQVERLDDLARDGGATAVLSVGLAPGVTNLLAKRMTDQLSSVSDIRIGVLLGLGEAFGPSLWAHLVVRRPAYASADATREPTRLECGVARGGPPVTHRSPWIRCGNRWGVRSVRTAGTDVGPVRSTCRLAIGYTRW